jgi:hypothetical protein
MSEAGGRARMPAEELLAFRETTLKHHVILSYSGYVTERILTAIAGTLKQAILGGISDIGTSRKVFSVFVEQVQNIIRYSAERHQIHPRTGSAGEVTYGFVAIGERGNVFFVTCGNLLHNTDVAELKGLLDEVVDLDKHQLRKLYKKRLRGTVPEHSKGAGLGIIEIARSSSRPVEYAFRRIDDDHTFFCMKAFI